MEPQAFKTSYIPQLGYKDVENVSLRIEDLKVILSDETLIR